MLKTTAEAVRRFCVVSSRSDIKPHQLSGRLWKQLDGEFMTWMHYPEMEADYTYLAKELSKLGIVYVHLVDHSAIGARAVPQSIKDIFRKEFKGALILSGGYDAARAEADLAAHKADRMTVTRLHRPLSRL